MCVRNGRIQQAGYNGINKARRGYDVRPFSSKSTSRRELILLPGGGGGGAGGGHVCTQEFKNIYIYILGREIICRIGTLLK